MRRDSLTGILTAGVSLVLAACGGGDGGNGGNNGRPNYVNPGLPAVVSVAPENTGDGWTPSTPASEGMNTDALRAALEAIRTPAYTDVDSVVVVRHGRLVAEGYYNGFGRETLHDLRSTGKSFTSALAGIAIEQGLFDADDPISQHIPQFERHANMSARKQAIQIFHLLNMNSGLECNDWEPTSRGNEERMYDARDWVGFILDLPMAYDPGQASQYCTGGVVVLGHIISQRSGMALDAYAASYLFGPLGIQDSGWRRSPDGAATGGGGLGLRPRDAAKLGQLYLSGGTWNGVRVVPTAWTESSQQRVNRIGATQYGYLWWKRSFSRPGGNVDSYYTDGNGGNYIFVIPSLDLVVVFTGSNYNSPLSAQPYSIMTDRVLPAVLP
jgi:CubicO group peptidase (beta-lactamase class C family)